MMYPPPMGLVEAKGICRESFTAVPNLLACRRTRPLAKGFLLVAALELRPNLLDVEAELGPGAIDPRKDEAVKSCSGVLEHPTDKFYDLLALHLKLAVDRLREILCEP